MHGRGSFDIAQKPAHFNIYFTYNEPLGVVRPFLPPEFSSLSTGGIQGETRLFGSLDRVQSSSTLGLIELGNEELGCFSTKLVVHTTGDRFTIEPATLTRSGKVIATIDTITNRKGALQFHAIVSNLDLATIIPADSESEPYIKAVVSGSIETTVEGFPLQFSVTAQEVALGTIMLTAASAQGTLTTSGMQLDTCTLHDERRSVIGGTARIPWSVIVGKSNETDTLRAAVTVSGDLLATIEHNFNSSVGGHGQGSARIAFAAAGDNWRFTEGVVRVPQGVLTVKPFVLDEIKEFAFLATVDSSGLVHTNLQGTIRKRPIRIFSEQVIPPGYEPLQMGPFNFGVLQVVTPKKGVDLHLPGFMALKERGDIEFLGKSPFKNFTISGPFDRLKLTGSWVLRGLEFTFPMLPNNEVTWDFDPFPYITWEMDFRPGDRKVRYFWDLVGKRKRLMRFVEGYLDLSSGVRLRGRDLDKTFRVYGALRSYKGAAYYGRVFDRNFDVGVEFFPQKPDKNQGYNNLPLLWGSAESDADSNRRERIKLTSVVNDPATGTVSEKGRLLDGPTPNIIFHLSSDFEEMPGGSEREYYQQAGITVANVGGAGSAVSQFGEQMFHRYLLQRWERRFARSVGLDVINIESSIVSNYFNKLYGRQFEGLFHEDDYLAFANVGVTVGRYFFRDFLLLKARGELIPIEMMLKPEYSIGLEFQPSRYLMMDVNYGFHVLDAEIQHNPLLMLQVRLPIRRMRNLLKF